jgi:hypothetical protein
MLETIASLNDFAEAVGVTEVLTIPIQNKKINTDSFAAQPDEFLRNRWRHCRSDTIHFI